MKNKFFRLSIFIVLMTLSFHAFSQKARNDKKYTYARFRDSSYVTNPPVTYYSISPTYGIITGSVSENQNTGFGFLFKASGADTSGNELPYFIETGVMYFTEKETPYLSNFINRPLAILPINIGYLFTSNKFKYGLSTGIIMIPSYDDNSEPNIFKAPKYFNFNPIVEYQYKHLLMGAYYSFIAKKEPVGYFGLKIGYKFKTKPKLRFASLKSEAVKS